MCLGSFKHTEEFHRANLPKPTALQAYNLGPLTNNTMQQGGHEGRHDDPKANSLNACQFRSMISPFLGPPPSFPSFFFEAANVVALPMAILVFI